MKTLGAMRIRVMTREPSALVDVLDRVLTKGVVIFTGRRAKISVEAHTQMDEGRSSEENDTALVSAADEYLSRLPNDAPHLHR